MTVCPQELQGIPTYLQEIDRDYVFWNYRHVEDLSTAHLFDASGAPALQSEVAIGI
jgi:hypothetical protein